MAKHSYQIWIYEGKSGYMKANMDVELELCRKIENLAQGKKHLLYELITIPFSTKRISK